ncbi:C40 family peptidase [Peribacillus frigoritolerans]|nr:C40 family peptidase [Peribacillus frigoritolerans]UZD49280.1 C40 family peptidase [Peribacillus frigoritolerans]
MAIYIGNNEFIHSSSSNRVSYAKTNNTYWKPKYIGAKRI